jgi:glucokinase
VNGDGRAILAIDIGGTKMAAGLVTPEGRLLVQDREPTRAADGPEQAIARLIDLCCRLPVQAGLAQEQVAVAGVCCAGPVDQAAGLVLEPPNLPGWVDLPLAARLRDALGVPVYLENDANAAALGEHRFGAGRGIDNMVYLTISTGIGGGVVIGGRLYAGENGNAGEIGHMTVVYNGRRCGCGNRGCLEAYASGTGIAARAREAVLAGEPSGLLALAGSVEAITAETVVDAVREGDRLAGRIWDETVEILGAGVANVINVFNPRRVVLGGGIASLGEMLLDPVRRIALSRAMRPLAQVAEIVPAELTGHSGLLGAAAVAMDRSGTV